jgi:hypothetical protein
MHPTTEGRVHTPYTIALSESIRYALLHSNGRPLAPKGRCGLLVAGGKKQTWNWDQSAFVPVGAGSLLSAASSSSSSSISDAPHAAVFSICREQSSLSFGHVCASYIPHSFSPVYSLPPSLVLSINSFAPSNPHPQTACVPAVSVSSHFSTDILTGSAGSNWGFLKRSLTEKQK